MRIIELEIQNFKRIKNLTVKAKEHVNIVGGRNAQGKSSVLDAITSTFCGKSERPAQPLRTGTKRGKIVIKCDADSALHQKGITAELTFDDKNKQTLVLKSSDDGIESPSPQAILDDLYTVGFDPLRFTTLKPKEQIAELKALLGLDFSEQEAERDTLYRKRTDVNARGKSLKARVDAMPWNDDAPEEELDVSTLLIEQKRCQEITRTNAENRKELDRLAAVHDQANQKLTALEERLLEIQAQIVSQKEILTQVAEAVCVQTEIVIALIDADANEVTEQIRTAGELNRKIGQNRSRTEQEAEVEKLRVESQSLTDQIRDIDEVKAAAMAAAKWPVAGLGFSDDGVTFNGLPFDQSSTTEKIEVAASVAMAQNPRLRVMIVRDSGVMNPDRFESLCKIAEERDYQLWIERNTFDKAGEAGCTLVIEDGAAKVPAEETASTAS